MREAQARAADSHFARLREGRAESIETSSIHMDVIRDLKRINGHLTPVAYPILKAAGELADNRLRTAPEPKGYQRTWAVAAIHHEEVRRTQALSASSGHPSLNGHRTANLQQMDSYSCFPTEFVAHFIGRANILSAKVMSTSEVHIEDVRVGLATGRALGDTVRLVIRPEMTDILPAPGPARVMQRTFLGEKTDYHVKLRGETLQVSTTDHFRKTSFEVGQAVTVQFRPGDIHALP